MLHAICLDVKWLQSALFFRHHIVKTRPPGGRTNKRFGTKANLSAYLRSCSCTGCLIDSVYLSAKHGDSVPLYPVSWSDPLIFSKCHYAPMHILFLGHVKSDIDMVSKWLRHYERLDSNFIRKSPSSYSILELTNLFYQISIRNQFKNRSNITFLEWTILLKYFLNNIFSLEK